MGPHGSHHVINSSASSSPSTLSSSTGAMVCRYSSNTNMSPDCRSVDIDSTTIECDVVGYMCPCSVMTAKATTNLGEHKVMPSERVVKPESTHFASAKCGPVVSTRALSASSVSTPASLYKPVTSTSRTSLSAATRMPSTAAEHSYICASEKMMSVDTVFE